MVMGNITVHEFITLDGVVENPGWTRDYGFDPRMGQAIAGLMGSSEALLMGRATYEMFAPAWSSRSAEEDPGAPFMNDSPKYVVSSSLKTTEWQNSTVLGPYDREAIQSLKERLTANIYVSGSVRLVRAMLADGLVDELHLFLYPLVLGRGQKLFEGDGTTVKLILDGTETYEAGVLHLSYRRS
jgi:dihydrofolate reductase